MVNEVNLTICLISHHGHWDDYIKDARLIQRVSFEKGVPITYFFSGDQIDNMANNRGRIQNDLWFDVVGAIQGRHFINPRLGDNNAFMPELGIMTYNHIPLVQPWQQDKWGEYFEGFLKEQINWSQCVAEQKYNKTPVTIHPPDGIYAPAAADIIRKQGLDSIVVSSEFLGDRKHEKGKLYFASGLKHVMRTNDIQLQGDRFTYANHFIDAVEAYGHQNNVPFVVVSCDIDEFNGMRNLSLHDGIAKLCCIGDEAINRHGRVKLINANAASNWNYYHDDITSVWGWNDAHAMIYRDGGLGFIREDRNNEISHVIRLTGERHRQGWDVREARGYAWKAMDAACRNNYCADGLTGHYSHHIGMARHLLQG